MSNKLQNIKAVQQLLDGTHKSQTRTTVGFNKDSKHERHEVGDVWEEVMPNGTTYIVTQKKGFRIRKPKNSVKSKIKDLLKVPEQCPSCGTEMRNEEKRLNFKFWFKRKKCFGCVIKEEQEIRNQGPDAWQEYEQRIMSENAESWFKDTDAEVELLKTQIKETYWQNADGENGQVDISSVIEKIENDYKELKSNVRKQFGTIDEQ